MEGSLLIMTSLFFLFEAQEISRIDTSGNKYFNDFILF